MRIPGIITATAITAAVLGLGACAGVPATPDTAAVPVAAARAVSAVTVTFSDHAQQVAASDPRLTPADVALAIESELRAQQLYSPGANSVHRTLVVTVEDFTSTVAGNASVMGYTFRNVVLIGEVQVQVQGEPAGSRPAIEVHARARAANRDSSAAAGSFADLYARFAVLTVEALRGIESPSELIPR